jgi:hypothetical protein
LEEGDLHSLFSDNKQLIDDDSDLDAQAPFWTPLSIQQSITQKELYILFLFSVFIFS